MSFSFQIRNEEGLILINLSGNLMGKYQVEELLNELDFHINEGSTKVIIDFSEIKHINSTGLNILINILTQVRNKEGELVLINISEKINKLLLITKLNNIFNIKNTLEDAKKVLI